MSSFSVIPNIRGSTERSARAREQCCIIHSWTNLVYSYLNWCPCFQRTYLSLITTKPTIWPVRPAKTQISLGICPVWSESSLCAQWVAKDPMFNHADRSFCWFCRAQAHLVTLPENLQRHLIGYRRFRRFQRTPRRLWITKHREHEN